MEAAPLEVQDIEAVLQLQGVEAQPLGHLLTGVQGQEQEVRELLEVQVLEQISLIEARRLEVAAIDHPVVEVQGQEAADIEALEVVQEVQVAPEVLVVRVGLRQAVDLQVHVVAVEEEINTWPKIIQERFKI